MTTTRKPARILTSSIAALAALAPSFTNAATIYWDRGAATNAWGTAANWSTLPGAATPDPAAAPVAADLAVFNISTLNTAQTVDMGADRPVLGLQFVTTGTLALQGGGANRTLTLGASGLDKTATGTGAITIGSGTANQNVNVRLSADQTWQNNNNAGAIVVNNTLTASSAVARILTLGGSSTAGNQINAVVSNNGAGVFSIVKTGASTWIMNGANTFTGGTTISGGIFRTLNNTGLGTGAVTIGSGSTGRLQVNAGLTVGNAININAGVTGATGQGLIEQTGTGVATLTGTITLNAFPTVGGTFRGGTVVGNELRLNGAINSGAGTGASIRDGRVVFAGGGNATGTLLVTNTAIVGATNGMAQGWHVHLGSLSSGNGFLQLNGFNQTLAAATLGHATLAQSGNVALGGQTLTLNGDLTASASTVALANVITGTAGGTLNFGATPRNIAVGDNLAADDLLISATAITSTGGVTKTGTGTLSLNNVSVTGGLFATAGNLTAGHSTAGGTITTDTLALSANVGLNMHIGSLGGAITGGTVIAGGSNLFTLKQAGTPVAVGAVPLVSYTGTTPGVANFTLATLPGRVVGSLIDTGTAIALDVTGNDSVKWTGATSAVWDVNTTQNWQTVLGAAATGYLNGDDLVFDDTGIAPNPNVTLGVAITPSRLTFSQTTPNTYSVSGAGSIQGGASIEHSGTGSTRIATLNNSFTGPVNVTAGSLELDHGAVAAQTVLSGASVVAVSAGATVKLTSDNVDFTFNRNFSGAGTVLIDANTGGTAGPRSVTLNGTSTGFTGLFQVTPTAAGGTQRFIAANANATGMAAIDVDDGGQFWAQGGVAFPNNLTLTGAGYAEAAGGTQASIAAATTGGVYLGTGTTLFTTTGIGAIRGDGQTLNGNIALSGHVKLGSHANTVTLGGVISGAASDTLVFGGGTGAHAFILTGNNTYEGRTWVNGGSAASAVAHVLQIGNNTTTGSLGTGEVVLFANSAASSTLRFQRSDGYTLATGQNIIAAGALTTDIAGRANVQANVQGTGLTLNGNTIDLTDGVNGGDLQVGVNITGASVNLNGASVVDVRNFWVGEQANFSATVNHAGTSSVTSIGNMRIGHWSTETSSYNISGGTLNMNGTPAAFPFQTAANLETNGGIYLGIDGQGMLNQTGGTIQTNFVVLDNRGDSVVGANMVTGVDTLQLNAGTLQLKSASGIISRYNSTAVNLNGGTIQAAVGINPALDSNTITVQAGGVTLDGNGGSTFNLYGPLAGTGTVALTGNGVLSTLDGTGATLTAAGGGGLGGSLGTASASLSAGSTLASNRASGVEVWSGAVSGAGAITKAGAGTLQLAGNYSGLNGAITVNGGRAELLGTFAATQAVTVNDGGTVSGEPTISSLTIGSVAGATVSFNANTAGALTVDTLTVTNGTTNALDFNTVPSGAAPWNVINYTTLVGTGSFALGPTYRGGTITDTGFNIQVDSVTRQALTWTGGTNGNWDINTTANNWNNTTPAADLFFNADDVAFGDGPTNVAIALTGSLKPWAVNVNAATTNYTFTSTTGNQLAGPVGITKSGASNLTLVGPNVHFGANNISAGTVTIADAASLGSGSATNSVNLTNNAALTATAAITLGANRTLNLGTGGGTVNLSNAAAQTVTLNGPITGAGALNLRSTLAGGGNFALSGNNAGFTGAITVGGLSTGISTLTIANSAAAGNASSITLNFPAAGVNGNSTNLALLNGVTMPATTTLNFTSSLPTAAISLRSGITVPAAATVNINSPITLSGDSIIQIFANAGATVNYGGAITETAPGAFTQSGLQAFSNVFFLRGGALGTHNINNTITLPSAGSTVSVTDGATAILNVAGNDFKSASAAFGILRIGVTDAVPTTARLVIGQTGDQSTTFDLNGFDQTVAGLEWAAVNGNLLTKGISNTHATATSTFTLNQATAPTAANFNGTISGRTNFVKNGAATVSLIAPASTFTGNVTVNAGTLSATGLGAANGANGTLGAANVAGKTVTVNNAGTVLSFLTNNIFGNGVGNANLPAVTIDAGTLNSTRYNVLGALTLNGGTLSQSSTDTGGYEGFQFLGNVTVGGTAASTISTGNAKANHLGANTTFTVADATTGVDLLVSAPLRNQSADFASAAGGLTKSGPGTMELSAVNTYTGPTTINAGVLRVSGSISGSAVTVDGATAVLGGTGTVGATTLLNGGTINAGASPGILNVVGNFTMSLGTTFGAEIDGTTVGTQYDQLNVTGTVTLADATLTLSGAYTTSTPGDLFTLILNDGAGDAVSGTFAGLGESASVFNGGQEFTISYVGGDGNDVVLFAVPEPGSAVMLLGGVGMLLGLQRRRRK